MRYLYSLLIVIFISSTSWGQIFTMSELIKMSKMDSDYFDSFIISKGYDFIAREKVNESNYTLLTYQLTDGSNENRTRTMTIAVGAPYIKYLAINYETYQKEEYLKLKEEIKKLGYLPYDLDSLHDSDGKSSVSFHFINGKSVIKVLNQTRFFTFSVSELK